MPIYLVHFITTRCNANCRHCLLGNDKLYNAGGKEKELTIVDATERTVTVPIPLERVVIFSSYSAEAMRAIGVDLSEKIVGAYDFMIRRRPEYFSEIADKPNVGSGKEPDYEKIAELQPEVVVFYPYYKPNVKEEVIEKMGAVVLYESLYEPDAISQELKKLGMIYQKEEQAEELIKWYQSYEELIVSRTSKLSPDEIPKVFLYSFPYYYKEKGIYATNNREGLFHHSAVKAGLVNIAADLPVKNPRVSLEWILVQDPNVIIGQLGDIASYAAEESVIDELKELREQIRNTPKPKKEPDQETLNYWNEIASSSLRLENELREKEELLEQLREL